MVKKYWMSIGLMPLLIALLTGCATAVYHENFDEITDVPAAIQTDNIVAGVSSDDGVLRLLLPQAERGERGHIWLTPDADLQDYTVTARMRILDGRVRLWLRTDTDLCSGYALQIDPIRDNYRLSQSGDGCDLVNVDMQQRRNVELNTWYEMQISVSGDSVRGYIDGVEFFETTDSRFAGSTTIAFEVIADLQGGSAEIDELTISR